MKKHCQYCWKRKSEACQHECEAVLSSGYCVDFSPCREWLSDQDEISALKVRIRELEAERDVAKAKGAEWDIFCAAITPMLLKEVERRKGNEATTCDKCLKEKP